MKMHLVKSRYMEVIVIKIKQVFKCYGRTDSTGIRNIRYCSSCGAGCLLKEEGGKVRPVCPECGFVHYKNPSPAVSVVIESGGKVLLGKRSQGSYMEGKWCLPCGFIEFDEDYITAARREVMEETGLQVRISGIISVNTNFLSPDLHSLVIVLLAHIVSGASCPGDDLEALGWYDVTGELPEMAFEGDIHIIERYFAERFQGLAVDPAFSG